MQSSQYTVQQFITENTVTDPSGVALLADVVGAYRVQCFHRGVRPENRAAIIAALQSMGHELIRVRDVYGYLGFTFCREPRYRVENGQLLRNKSVPAGLSVR
jgi:hypothetical protein